MIESLIKKNREVIRQLSREIRASASDADKEIYNDCLDYYERKKDHHLLRDKMIDRFAVSLEEVKAPDGTVLYEKYVRFTKGKQAAMIAIGAYEALTSGFYQQIVGARATLFNSKTQSWDWVQEVGEEKKTDEKHAELIRAHRKAGDFEQHMSDADKVSCAIESGPMMTSYKAGHLSYDAFSPVCLNAVWPDSITDDGEARAPSQREIEDAYCIVIQMGANNTSTTSDIENQSYLAIFARSVEYPYGRHVEYNAQSWDRIPRLGTDPNAIEWTWDGSGDPDPKKIANPLSYYAATNDNKLGVEYPVIVLRGGLQISGMSDTITPLSASLYENSVEIDVAISRLIKDALNSARGKDVFSDPEGEGLPRSFEAVVPLARGQSMQVMGIPASNAKEAMEVVKDGSRSIAGGFSVPGYMVISEPGGQPESGYAIALRTTSLVKDREQRIKLNNHQVERQYAIEQGLLAVHADIAVAEGTEQIWNPGRYIVPQNQKEKTENISLALEKQLTSYVRAIRDYYDLPDDAAAKKMIEKIQKDNEEYPAPGSQQKSPLAAIGLTPRAPKQQEDEEDEEKDEKKRG